MTRTRLDIDASVLRQLKQRCSREGKSLGQIASELLARALARTATAEDPQPLQWRTAPMEARVDLEDKDALSSALDRR